MRLLFSLLLAGSLFAGSPVGNNDAAKTGLDPGRLAQIPVRMKQFVDRGTSAGIVMGKWPRLMLLATAIWRRGSP